jgi:predicted HD superfamily hydrolase involved in NAD metabolism
MTSTTHAGIPDALTLQAAQDWLKPRISQRRYAHSEGVVETAGTLATKCGADEFLARLAGWLHDACKEVKDKELVDMARKFGLKLHPVEEMNGHLLHGPVAAEVARQELGVTNQHVLDAIAQHTLGAKGPLSQILFLADALEPGRPHDYVKPIWRALHPCVWPEGALEKHSEIKNEVPCAKSAERSGKEQTSLADAAHGAGLSTEASAHGTHADASHSAHTFLYGLEALRLTSQIAPDLDKAILVACDLGLIDLLESGRLIHPKTVDVRNYYLQVLKSRHL